MRTYEHLKRVEDMLLDRINSANREIEQMIQDRNLYGRDLAAIRSDILKIEMAMALKAKEDEK